MNATANIMDGLFLIVFGTLLIVFSIILLIKTNFFSKKNIKSLFNHSSINFKVGETYIQYRYFSSIGMIRAKDVIELNLFNQVMKLPSTYYKILSVSKDNLLVERIMIINKKYISLGSTNFSRDFLSDRLAPFYDKIDFDISSKIEILP